MTVELQKKILWENWFETTHFFINNTIFLVSLKLLSEVPKMRLKIAMKLNFQFEARQLLTKLL